MTKQVLPGADHGDNETSPRQLWAAPQATVMPLTDTRNGSLGATDTSPVSRS